MRTQNKRWTLVSSLFLLVRIKAPSQCMSSEYRDWNNRCCQQVRYCGLYLLMFVNARYRHQRMLTPRRNLRIFTLSMFNIRDFD